MLYPRSDSRNWPRSSEWTNTLYYIPVNPAISPSYFSGKLKPSVTSPVLCTTFRSGHIAYYLDHLTDSHGGQPYESLTWDKSTSKSYVLFVRFIR